MLMFASHTSFAMNPFSRSRSTSKTGQSKIGEHDTGQPTWSTVGDNTYGSKANNDFQDQLVKAQQPKWYLPFPFHTKKSNPVPPWVEDNDLYTQSLSMNDGSSWAQPADKSSHQKKATLQESLKHNFDAAKHVTKKAMNIPVNQIYALYQQLPNLKTRDGRDKFKDDVSASFTKMGTSAPTAQDFEVFFKSIKENMSLSNFKKLILQLFSRTNKNAKTLEENEANFNQH